MVEFFTEIYKLTVKNNDNCSRLKVFGKYNWCIRANILGKVDIKLAFYLCSN